MHSLRQEIILQLCTLNESEAGVNKIQIRTHDHGVTSVLKQLMFHFAATVSSFSNHGRKPEVNIASVLSKIFKVIVSSGEKMW